MTVPHELEPVQFPAGQAEPLAQELALQAAFAVQLPAEQVCFCDAAGPGTEETFFETLPAEVFTALRELELEPVEEAFAVLWAVGPASFSEDGEVLQSTACTAESADGIRDAEADAFAFSAGAADAWGVRLHAAAYALTLPPTAMAAISATSFRFIGISPFPLCFCLEQWHVRQPYLLQICN